MVQAAGAKHTASVTIAAPGIVLSAGASLRYVPSFVSWHTHSVTVAAADMTNLNQIDKDLKALIAVMAEVRNDVVLMRTDVSEVKQKIDELIGGPSDDETQAEIDAKAAKLSGDADAINDAISSNPDSK